MARLGEVRGGGGNGFLALFARCGADRGGALLMRAFVFSSRRTRCLSSHSFRVGLMTGFRTGGMAFVLAAMPSGRTAREVVVRGIVL